jgi:hypothetical protein
VSVNEKNWLVMHMHVQLKLDELRGPPNPWQASELDVSFDSCVPVTSLLSVLQAHPVTATPCFMLHPCQTAARMQLLLQTAAEGAPGEGAAGPAGLSASASAADLGAESGGEGDGSQGQPTNRADLLTYARGWFSMVLPLLGLSMLQAGQ